MNNKIPDIFEEDFYDDAVIDREVDAIERFEQKISTYGKLVSDAGEIAMPEFQDSEDFSKTMELKFIDGILHQLVQIYKIRTELHSGEAIVVGEEKRWEPVPSE